MEPHLLFERDGHVAVVTLNRPEARNALSGQMLVRMADAWTEIDEDPDIRVAVVTGAGGHFCAGADLKAMAAGHPDDEWTPRFAADPDLHWRALLRHFQPRKPLIAAVEGYALAGGTELALAADMIVASRESAFGIPEVKRGLVAGGGGLLRLPERIPYSIAMELALTGDILPAERAHDLGLVNALTEPGAALDGAIELAERIAANGPLAVATTKRIIIESKKWTPDTMFAEQGKLMAPVFSSNDAKEGAIAFAEKRAPNWTGT